jgi:tetratricopeptide (TPR) repeat protein
MPKRPREHRLDEDSVTAFKTALAERFLFREDTPDYGIDGSVEEFGQDDVGTGLRYFVQLKATDGVDPDEALKRSIPIEHANLYSSLSLPLLMVRYVAAEDELYVRWWHDPLPGKRAPKPNAASLTFHWSPEDHFQAGDSARLAGEARGFLELRSVSLPLPVHFKLDVEDPPFGLTRAEIELAVKAEAAKRPDVVELRRGEANGRLLVHGKYMAVEMPGMRASSYDLDGDYDSGLRGEQLAVDLMTLVAIAFTRWGQSELASRMTTRFFARSTLVGQPEAAMALASAMTSARRIGEALVVAEEIDALGLEAEQNMSLFFTLTSRQHSASLSEAEVEEFRETLRRRIERREEAGQPIEASREVLTLGNHYRSRSDPLLAIKLYKRAAVLDPEYRERAHYWFEMAGVLFLAEHFEESIEAYERAIEMGSDEVAPLLRADAMMFAGRYEEAQSAFIEALGGEESFERGAEYYLKLGLLEFLIDTHQRKCETREPEAAAKVISAAIRDGEEPDLETAMLSSGQALVRDSLCNLAWWNLGLAFETIGKVDMAATMFLNAALCAPGDEQAWALAYLHFSHLGRDELLPMILVTGERLTGKRLLPTINEVMSKNLDDEERNRRIAELSEMLEELADPRSDGFELRFVASGKEVESMIIPGASTRRD